MKNIAKELDEIFECNADCDKNTGWSSLDKYKTIRPVKAMTKEKFITIVTKLLCDGNPVPDTEANEVLPDAINRRELLLAFCKYHVMLEADDYVRDSIDEFLASNSL